MVKTASERYEEYRQRKKEEGYREHKVWVRDEDWPTIKALIDKLNKGEDNESMAR